MQTRKKNAHTQLTRMVLEHIFSSPCFKIYRSQEHENCAVPATCYEFNAFAFGFFFFKLQNEFGQNLFCVSDKYENLFLALMHM